MAASVQQQLIPEAMALFWRQGFYSTSIEEVVQELGVNRYAIYNAFGGKKELFLESLEYYFQMKKAEFFVLSNESASQLDFLKGLFYRFFEEFETHTNGCFVCNTFVEVAPKDQQVSEICLRYQDELTEFFQSVLEKAQEAGEVRGSVDVAKVARTLLAVHMGISIRAKAGEAKETLLEAVEGLLEVIVVEPT